jgi:class 3 adenylate cyclase
MVDDARIDAGAAAYRGFLFSDVRGFTAFAERYGNSAAAAMVGRFLEIARKAIARHEGAEIKTEGDAIHAVFPSASSAVLCGLEIQDAAAELNVKEPDRPLGLGVGIHAGEAVETAEGYIGRAVNIAARLCAVARPGEVLVSSTVKGITQASITVGFIPRGRRRLKGIEDPILVYAVTRDVNAKAPRTLPRPVIFGAAGVAVVAVLAIAVVAGSQLLTSPPAIPKATDPPAGQRVIVGPLAVGTYRSVQFEPPVRFDIRETGWAASGDVAGKLRLVRDAPPLGEIQFLRVQQVIDNPCVQGGEGAQTNPGAADLLTTLQGLTHLDVSDPQTVGVGGYAGREVAITVLDSALMACGGAVGGGVPILHAGGEDWQAVPGERFRLIAVTVGIQPVTIVVSTDWTRTPSVQELEALNQLGQHVIDSVRF